MKSQLSFQRLHLQRNQHLGDWLLLLGLGIFVIALCLLRLADLMLISGEAYRREVDENRFFRIQVPATRGVILDRDGSVLVKNTAHYFLATTSAQRLFASVWSLPQVTASEALPIIAASPSSVFVRTNRSPQVDPALSHVIGFTGFSTESDRQYAAVDERVGKSGLEKWFDASLRGVSGTQLIEISARGIPQRELTLLAEPRNGQDLQVAIDRELTDLAYASLFPSRGAAIVSEVPTGQVLAIVSSPSYSNASLSAALKDSAKPMLNRALAAYPPGSTFKLMTALSALQAGTMTAETKINDTGEVKVGSQVFGNWYWRQYGRTEGMIDLTRAIARSNDIYFYAAAESVGVERIDATASQFGLGKVTGIELPGEAAGLLPNESWKEKQIGEKWYLGDTYNLGIGQGYLLASPAQITAMVATVARRGSWCPLTLQLTKDPACTEAQVSTSHVETVITGMVQACSTGGTAFPFFPINEQLPEAKKIACKTGTAEFGGSINEKGHKRTHGWFTMFYPREKPAVAITVFVESTPDAPFKEGSKDAAPIALKIFEAWREKYE